VKALLGLLLPVDDKGFVDRLALTKVGDLLVELPSPPDKLLRAVCCCNCCCWRRLIRLMAVETGTVGYDNVGRVVARAAYICWIVAGFITCW